MAINHNYLPAIGVCLGVFHVILGLTSCACGSALVSYGGELSQIAIGIWGGLVFYTMTGVLAFAAASRKNSVITAYYVLALLSVFVSMGQMAVHSWAVYDELYYNCDRDYCPDYLIRNMVLDGVVVFVAFVEWIIAMVSCCTACVCCFRRDPPQPIVIHTMQQPVVGQQVYGVPGGMVFTQQPYGGPAVAMAPPHAPYGGPAIAGMVLPQAPYDGGFPTENPGYSEKPPTSGGPGDPQAHNNVVFGRREEANLPQTPDLHS